jgi:hypothetical protein
MRAVVSPAKILEPIRRQRRVPRRILDIAVPQVSLERPLSKAGSADYESTNQFRSWCLIRSLGSSSISPALASKSEAIVLRRSARRRSSHSSATRELDAGNPLGEAWGRSLYADFSDRAGRPADQLKGKSQSHYGQDTKSQHRNSDRIIRGYFKHRGLLKPGSTFFPEMAARSAKGGCVPHSKSRIPTMQGVVVPADRGSHVTDCG